MTSFADLVSNGIAKELLDSEVKAAARGPRTPLVFWPSEARICKHGPTVLGTCLRQLFWRVTGRAKTELPSPRMPRIWDVGNDVEYREICHAKKAGLYIASGVKFRIDYKSISISGKLDAIYRDPATGRLYGIEYKTGYGYWYEKTVVGKGKAPGQPKGENLMQVMLYLHAFTGVLDAFNILYYDRGGFDYNAEYTVCLDANFRGRSTNVSTGDVFTTDYTVFDILDGYVDLLAYLQAGLLPPPDYDPLYTPAVFSQKVKKGELGKKKQDQYKNGMELRDWQCDYCPFLSACRTVEGR